MLYFSHHHKLHFWLSLAKNLLANENSSHITFTHQCTPQKDWIYFSTVFETTKHVNSFLLTALALAQDISCDRLPVRGGRCI